MNRNIFFILIIIASFFASCKQTNKELLDKGIDLSKQKNYAEAIEIYAQVIHNNNKLQLAYYNRGFCYFKLKNYPNALADFNTVMALQTHGDYIISHNKNLPGASEEILGEVSYNDALYERAQVKFYMDSIKSSYNDFQILLNTFYPEKSNCLLWQGALWIKQGKNDTACYYFKASQQTALTPDDKQQADKMITTYCGQPTAISSTDSSAKK
jgi:tetratricopeptide (TPR) repeat protein